MPRTVKSRSTEIAALGGIPLLEALFRIQSATWMTERMTRFVATQAELAGATVWVEDGSVYAVKGKAKTYPGVVAHTDTVHCILSDDQYEVLCIDGVWTAWNPVRERATGIGGDDKVGIWIALTALQVLPAVKAAFFRDEEKGLDGANHANLGFFEDVGYLIEADRRGDGDFIRTARGLELHGDEFAESAAPVIARYGYRECHEGAGTDVVALVGRGVGIAACNVACGYHNAHTERECVVQEQAERACDLVLDLCRTLGRRRFEHLPDLRW